MTDLTESTVTATAALPAANVVTLITTPQWAECLRQLQTASHQRCYGAVVTFVNGVPHVGTVLALESCRKS